MAAVNNSVGIGGGGATSLTSGSVSPGGSDRVVVAADISETGYSTQANYGGSGGTSLGASFAQGLADSTLGSGNLNVRVAAPGPSGATTMYHLWGSSTASAAGSTIFLTGADQTTPLTALTPVSGADSGTKTFTTGAIPGLSAGQLVIMAVGAHSEFGGDITSIASGNASTTVVGAAYGTLSGGTVDASAWAYGFADGAGALTLAVTITESGVLYGYLLLPFAVADAGAAPPPPPPSNLMLLGVG